MSDVRLIDANSVVTIQVFDEMTEEYSMETMTVAEAIDRWADEGCPPTIDAVPVVRCGECKKFWEYTESHKATVEKADGDCMIRCMVAPDDPQFCAVQKDDYCSMGVRMGGQDTTAPTTSDRGCSTCANDGYDMPQCRECTEHPGYPWYKRKDEGAEHA